MQPVRTRRGKPLPVKDDKTEPLDESVAVQSKGNFLLIYVRMSLSCTLLKVSLCKYKHSIHNIPLGSLNYFRLSGAEMKLKSLEISYEFFKSFLRQHRSCVMRNYFLSTSIYSMLQSVSKLIQSLTMRTVFIYADFSILS